MTHQVDILGVKVNQITFVEAVAYIKDLVQKEGQYQIATVNPEFVVTATRDQEFQKILESVDLAVPDGVGLVMAGKILGTPLKGRVPGTDLVEELARVGEGLGWRFYLLGGRQGSGELASKLLRIRYPQIKIAGFFEGDGSESGDIETVKIVKGAGKIDILLVAYGHPKQEKWIKRNLAKTEAKVAIGVGGAFDYLSNQKKRAPGFLRQIGFEWAYRLIWEPWRLKRQLDLPKFVLLVIKKKLLG